MGGSGTLMRGRVLVFPLSPFASRLLPPTPLLPPTQVFYPPSHSLPSLITADQNVKKLGHWERIMFWPSHVPKLWRESILYIRPVTEVLVQRHHTPDYSKDRWRSCDVAYLPSTCGSLKHCKREKKMKTRVRTSAWSCGEYLMLSSQIYCAHLSLHPFSVSWRTCPSVSYFSPFQL